jgi:RNA polymerase sigma factor (sigma-70 family)
MQTRLAFRNLDRHGQQRAPEVIEEELRQLKPHLARFREDLVHLDVVASQTRGKTRIRASLRLQLPSGLLVAHEDGFGIEPVLRKAFADLRHRLDRHVARLRHESAWKRPARRARIGAPLPPARDKAEAERRALYFDLIEDHLDRVHDTVRRELTYLEASGTVPAGRLNVGDLVDATILRGLERFEQRPAEFSVDDWLTRLALETVEAEARAARRAMPEPAASLEAAPEAPAEEPTEADQEMFEFYQPDDTPRLEDLVVDESALDPETETERREAALILHRAIANLPVLWRQVLFSLHLDEATPAATAALLGLSESAVQEIAAMAASYLRAKLQDAGVAGDAAEPEAIGQAILRTARLPLPIAQRHRLAAMLSVEVGIQNKTHET